jgi:hypothetical protein
VKVLTHPDTGAIEEMVRADETYLPSLRWVVVGLALLLGALTRVDRVGATLIFMVATFWIWIAGCVACWATRKHPHRHVLLVVPPMLLALAVGLVLQETQSTPRVPGSEVTVTRSGG